MTEQEWFGEAWGEPIIRELTDTEVASAQERIAWRLYDMWWEEVDYLDYQKEVIEILGIDDDPRWTVVRFPDEGKAA